jgi:hypothetical protein
MTSTGFGKARLPMLLFGVYVIALGSVLVVAPNFLLLLFGFPETREVWIRVAAVLACALGFYYLKSIRENVIAMARWSVPARLFAAVSFGTFVLLGWAPPQLLIFAVIDFVFSVWTALALRA